MPSVCIIGGGMAGLSSAVFLKQHDIDVTLVEAAPKLGGRTSSFFDSRINDFLDNGQHILASWYYTTLELLKITGSLYKLKFQKQMEVHLADNKGNKYLFKCPKLIPPLHLLGGIWKYRALSVNDKLGVIRLVNFLVLKKYEDDELSDINLIKLFEITNQPQNLVSMFWEPFVLAVFNAKPKNVSAWYFSNMVRTGFFKNDGARLILPNDTLSKIFVDGCEAYLVKKNTKLVKQVRCDKIEIANNKVDHIKLSDGENIDADYYISAVPFYEIKNLFDDPEYSQEINCFDNLTPSPIINIHHIYKNNNGYDALKYDFIGLLGTVVQWVFNVKPGHICLVISGADDIIDIEKIELIELSKNELCSCLPEFKDVKFIYSRVVKEKRATFLPNTASIKSRPANRTRFDNFFIAGDWTDTGLPSTIESAVLSGKKCAEEIIKLIH